MRQKLIMLVLFTATSVTWSQDSTLKTSREIINDHVFYVNRCVNHIAAMNHDANDFNYDLDQSVKSSGNHWIRKVAIQYDGQLHYKYTHAQLDSLYSKTVEQRTKLAPADRQALDIFFDGYQKLIHATNASFDAIKEFAGDGREVFSDNQIAHGYKLLTNLESNIKELTTQNIIFSDLASKLFGKEELPVELQLTKDIASVCQQIVRQIRNQDTEGLVQSIDKHEKLIKIRYTFKELEELDAFGDYRYTDNIQVQERANIDRSSKKFVEYADRYLNGGSAYATDYSKKRYGRQFAFEQSVIYLFHDYDLKLCKRYNEVIQRAYEPVLKMVQEPMPFKVHYEQGYESKVETQSIQQELVLTEPLKVIAERELINKGKTFTVNEAEIEILLYDHRRIDGDIVTIYLNEDIVVDKLPLVRKKKKYSTKLRPGANTITLHAENLGEVPPNTAAIQILGSNQKIEQVLTSDLNQSEFFTIYYMPED